jgi:uncharacterized protein YcnI
MNAVTRARALPRAAIVSGATAAALLGLFCVPAFAHITTTPSSVPAGSAAELTFHVPNEETHADTTKLDILIPTAHPIAQLLVQPVPGWQASVRTVNLAKPVVTDDGKFSQAVAEVMWSGGRIAPGQFQDFTVLADPLPQGVSQLVFKALQIYSNGDVVRWIDVRQPGQPEPGHPAPVLTLTKGAAPAAPGGGVAAPAAAPQAASGSDGLARGLAAAGLAVGLLGLAAAAAGRRRGKLAVQATAADAPTPRPPAQAEPPVASAAAAGARQGGAGTPQGGTARAAGKGGRAPAGATPRAKRRR